MEMQGMLTLHIRYILTCYMHHANTTDVMSQQCTMQPRNHLSDSFIQLLIKMQHFGKQEFNYIQDIYR